MGASLELLLALVESQMRHDTGLAAVTLRIVSSALAKMGVGSLRRPLPGKAPQGGGIPEPELDRIEAFLLRLLAAPPHPPEASKCLLLLVDARQALRHRGRLVGVLRSIPQAGPGHAREWAGREAAALVEAIHGYTSGPLQVRPSLASGYRRSSQGESYGCGYG